MAESEEDYYATEEADTDTKGSSKDDKKRRFSEEQVKSMELMFETQTKLEPRKKLQLAKELGLHPRQVAIWFQNKRARWKSKQLEREYNALRAEYDALLSNFESVKNEKQLLAKQLTKLGELTDDPMEEKRKRSTCSKADEMPNFLGKEKTENMMRVNSDDEENRSKEELGFFSELHMESEQQFCFHQPNWPSDHSGVNSQWWEFWPMNE